MKIHSNFEAVLLKSEKGWDSYKRFLICENCIFMSQQKKDSCNVCGGDGKLGTKTFYGNGNNYTGFNAIPSGQRVYLKNEFIGLNQTVYWDGTIGEQVTYFWTTSETKNYAGNTDHAITFNISNNSDFFQSYSAEKNHGFSVRCVKD